MTTTLQKLAGVFGVIFIIVAVLGFISPGGLVMAMDPTTGMVLGVFPVNLLHNIVHLLFGVWGLVASRSWSGSKTFFTVSRTSTDSPRASVRTASAAANARNNISLQPPPPGISPGSLVGDELCV